MRLPPRELRGYECLVFMHTAAIKNVKRTAKYKEATKISMTPKTTNARETEKRGNRRPEDSARNGRTDTYSVVPSNIVTVKVNRYTCDEPQSKVISRQHRQASWNYLSDMMSMQDPQLRSLCLLATALVGEHIQMARPPVLTFMQSLFNARRSTFSHLFSLRSCNSSVTRNVQVFRCRSCLHRLRCFPCSLCRLQVHCTSS